MIHNTCQVVEGLYLTLCKAGPLPPGSNGPHGAGGHPVRAAAEVGAGVHCGSSESSPVASGEDQPDPEGGAGREPGGRLRPPGPAGVVVGRSRAGALYLSPA